MSKFKVGDRVMMLKYSSKECRPGDTGIVTRVSGVACDRYNLTMDCGYKSGTIHESELGLKHSNPPHIHAEFIKAWADGADIQCRYAGGETWANVGNPEWRLIYEYRIKPVIDNTKEISSIRSEMEALANSLKKLEN